jgi:hypothetical protein
VSGDEVEALAHGLWTTARSEEQSARRIPDDHVADAVRIRIRQLARADGVRIRTARMDDAVVVVRLDAKVWTEDAATMRRKLAPPG